MHTLLLEENDLEELPSELGSCQQIAVLSIRNNHLNQLPPEIGQLSRLRVMNVSCNRLRHLPVSVLKLPSLNALWLSEAQTKPVVPLQTDTDPVTGHKVLTCFLLPQTPSAEISKQQLEKVESSPRVVAARSPTHIKFAFDGESCDRSGRLMRNPTPYPKELKALAKHAQHIQQQLPMSPSSQDRISNAFEGVEVTTSSRENAPLVQVDVKPPAVTVTNTGARTAAVDPVVAPLKTVSAATSASAVISAASLVSIPSNGISSATVSSVVTPTNSQQAVSASTSTNPTSVAEESEIVLPVGRVTSLTSYRSSLTTPMKRSSSSSAEPPSPTKLASLSNFSNGSSKSDAMISSAPALLPRMTLAISSTTGAPMSSKKQENSSPDKKISSPLFIASSPSEPAASSPLPVDLPSPTNHSAYSEARVSFQNNKQSSPYVSSPGGELRNDLSFQTDVHIKEAKVVTPIKSEVSVTSGFSGAESHGGGQGEAIVSVGAVSPTSTEVKHPPPYHVAAAYSKMAAEFGGTYSNLYRTNSTDSGFIVEGSKVENDKRDVSPGRDSGRGPSIEPLEDAHATVAAPPPEAIVYQHSLSPCNEEEKVEESPVSVSSPSEQLNPALVPAVLLATSADQATPLFIKRSTFILETNTNEADFSDERLQSVAAQIGRAHV